MYSARFAAFGDLVRYLQATEGRVRRDGHFNVQARVLVPDLIPYDFIGRFENFQGDLEQVLQQLDASPEIMATAAEVRNATNRVHPAIAFDRELADIAYGLYEEDFTRFSYEQDSWMYA